MSGTGLKVFVKRIMIFAVLKDKMTGKCVGSSLGFPLSHFLHVTPISLSNSCSNDQTVQKQWQNHKFQYFLSMFRSMSDC